MRKKEKEARKQFIELLGPSGMQPRPTGLELYSLMKVIIQTLEFTEKEFVAFSWFGKKTICDHQDCQGAEFCQKNALERSYDAFIRKFGFFNKYDYIHLRMLLRV